MEYLHVSFLVPIEVETFGEDGDSCRSFFWHQSVGLFLYRIYKERWLHFIGMPLPAFSACS